MREVVSFARATGRVPSDLAEFPEAFHDAFAESDHRRVELTYSVDEAAGTLYLRARVELTGGMLEGDVGDYEVRTAFRDGSGVFTADGDRWSMRAKSDVRRVE